MMEVASAAMKWAPALGLLVDPSWLFVGTGDAQELRVAFRWQWAYAALALRLASAWRVSMLLNSVKFQARIGKKVLDRKSPIAA